MIKLYLKLFKLTIDLKIDCKCDKHEKFSEEHPPKFTDEEYDLIDESNAQDDDIDENIVLSDIQIQASKFEEELRTLEGIHDIPIMEEDILPPRHALQDDVEIITEGLEKEIEDVIEGRR